jgi:hypothetical protein
MDLHTNNPIISDFLIIYQLFITIQNHPQIHLYPQFIPIQPN